MARSVSVYTSEVIDRDSLGELITGLAGEVSENGWTITRNDREIFVVISPEDLAGTREARKEQIARELGSQPKTCVVIVFFDSTAELFEFRMAKAVARAMAERWTVVFDDNAGNLERLTR